MAFSKYVRLVDSIRHTSIPLHQDHFGPGRVGPSKEVRLFGSHVGTRERLDSCRSSARNRCLCLGSRRRPRDFFRDSLRIPPSRRSMFPMPLTCPHCVVACRRRNPRYIHLRPRGRRTFCISRLCKPPTLNYLQTSSLYRSMLRGLIVWKHSIGPRYRE